MILCERCAECGAQPYQVCEPVCAGMPCAVVTSVRRGLVYYTYADAPAGAKGAFTMTVESWEDDYGGM